MVGVPGRSKGCVTCRLRKKGCDLRKPDCGTCEARGITCGGYDTDRMFVNYSHDARPPSSLASTSQTRAANSDTRSTQASSFDHRTVAIPVDVVLPQGLARSAYHEKTVETFFTLYMPDNRYDAHNQLMRSHSLVKVLSALYYRDEALRLAVVALGTAMLGKMREKEEWSRQGRRLYGQALQEMRKALACNQRSKSEALLVVPRIGAMFEMLFGADISPTMQAQSWLSHAQGELAIIKARGPYSHRDGIAHQIFVDGRLRPIIAAIRLRKATILNSIEWKTIPWETYPKTAKDSLLDILAGVPEILEDIDELHAHCSSPYADVLTSSIAAKCGILETEVKNWAQFHKDIIYHPDTEEAMQISFSDITVAHLSIYYWTTCLFIYSALAAVLPLDCSPFDHPRLYSRRIARAVPYFFDSSCGIWGAVMAAFPMGKALLNLVETGAEDNKEYLGLVYRAWMNPSLCATIRDFLVSMRSDATSRGPING